MKYLIILLFMFSNANNFQDFKKIYKDILDIEITIFPNTHIATSLQINKLPENSPFAELINDNRLLFNYVFLHNNVISRELNTKLLNDTTTYRQNYLKELQNSKKFDSLLSPIVEKYLQSKNLISDYSNRNEPIFSKEEILKIAIRFFYPSAILNDKIQTHICVGINGMDDFPHKGNLVLEGFIFQTIFENIDNPNYRIRENLENAKKIANKLDLSNNNKTILKRAQGVVWALMYNSKGLWQAITNAYKVKKNILPFKIGA